MKAIFLSKLYPIIRLLALTVLMGCNPIKEIKTINRNASKGKAESVFVKCAVGCLFVMAGIKENK